MSTPIELYDLTRHQVVEASAGTGKTHAIEKLVQRILVDEQATLDQILVVTFTEKATGELRSRLRDMLDKALQEHPDHGVLLRKALDQFDQAPIFTIHGFCQRLLQEFAFEQQYDFQPKLTEDRPLLQSLLRSIQRKTWRSVFGAHLRGVLESAGYERGRTEEWERAVVSIAEHFKPRCGHELRPALVADWWKRLDEADANWAGQLEVFTIDTLHQQFWAYKAERGLQSFDDMIAAVEESLDPMRNASAEMLLTRLRQRYRFGIVDEFQDTDPLQWRIFRRIFLDGGESRLIIVGDPKQAIYGFRGSDLPTYLAAARQMVQEFDAEKQTLDENWRSEPNLLDALNTLFGDGDWFPRDEGVGYVHVHAPDADLRTAMIEDDSTDRGAMTIVDVTSSKRLTLARRHYCRFIALEIQRLLAGGEAQPALTFSLKKQPVRPLRAGDICILVSKRTEAAPLIAALEAAGIPYSFHKRTGLWKCDEAMHLQILLETLAEPENRFAFRKALLTCFFRVKPDELARAPDVPTHHPARLLHESWLGWAQDRQWSALARSLLEDTGLLFCDNDAADAERRRANLRLMLAEMEQTALEGNFDLLGVLDWIKQRREANDGTPTPMMPEDAGRDRVKIMTIHACKGLEFPIVFLAGGFTKQPGDRNSFAAYHDQGHLVFDVKPGADARTRLAQEQRSEQRRLYYVALTRAIFKLYLPHVQITSRNQAHAGPIGEIVAPALYLACPELLPETVASVVTPPLSIQLTRQAATPAAQKQIAPSSSITIAGPLFPPLDPHLSRRRIVLRSFSSMARHHLAQLGDGASFGEQPGVIADEASAQPDEDPLRGPVFGDMVHNVLEQVDFAEVGRAAGPQDLLAAGAHALKLINAEVRRSVAQLRSRTPRDQLAQAAREQIAQLVWHALRTPLKEIGGPLCGIPKNDRLAEVEFIYPERPGPVLPAQERRDDGFVTGFIDLIFRVDAKYFLLDWKTNLLTAYSREQIERSMADADYPRQYRLYLQALARWLRRRHGERFSFTEQFGGVYYLYVRGLNGRDDQTGVFFHRPKAKELDLENVLT